MDNNNFYDINAPVPVSNYVFDINSQNNYEHQNNKQNSDINNNNNNNFNLNQLNNKNSDINNNKYDENDFLKFKDWDYFNDNNIFLFENKIEKIIQNINQIELKNLQKSISEANFNYVFQYPDNVQTISPISGVGNLVESTFAFDSSFKEDMVYHLIELEKYIYKWRSIDADGNCFYRGVIFSFLENTILNNNILLLKEIFILFDEKITINNPIFKRYNIDNYLMNLNISLVKQILYTIFYYLDKDNIKDAYLIFIKTFLYCSEFDYGMIFFLRYLIFEYILINQNKVYSKNFQIKLGNLLPDQYISDNDFKFKQFFQEQIMKMGIYAEKIVVYIIPYVLKCNLNIYLYNFDKNDKVILKSFNCPINGRFTIELFYREKHYDITYHYKYYSIYENYFKLYEFLNQKLKVIDTQFLEQVKKQSDLINNNENKVENKSFPCPNCHKISKGIDKRVDLCEKCFIIEVKNNLLIGYIQFLNIYTVPFNKIHQSLNKTFEQIFSSQVCKIKNIEYNGKELLTLINKTFYNLLQEIKVKICVQCQNEMKDKKGIFKLPCGCCLCSHDCYYTYFNNLMVNEVNIIKKNPQLDLPIFSACYCGSKYKIKDYLLLLEEFQRYNVQNYINAIIEVINNNCLKYCYLCLKRLFTKINSFCVFIKDENICNKLKVNKIIHICCHECIQKYQIDKKVYCNLCEKEQIILSIIPFESKDNYLNNNNQ